MSRNIWPIELGSLDRSAKPLISVAVDDSMPRDTAYPGSRSPDAMSLMLMESSKLKSEENTEVAIDHLVTLSARRCRQVPPMPERTEMGIRFNSST
jgi:hypothetical protein